MVTNPTLYPPDITITMVSKTHYFSANCMGNDECPLTLDDAGGVLGHAYFPDSSGTCREIHLDINERWYFGNNPNIPKNQTSFLMVLVHEIGHALGIAHSASPNAIMFAFYQHEIRGLDVDDINAVQYLYGRKNKYDSIPKSTTASAIPKTTTTIRSTTPTRLGDQCYYMETCKYTDQHASCIQVHHHAVCQCENGYHSVSIDRPSKKVFCAEDVAVMTSDFSTFAGVLSGIAILSGLICFVLHLFNQNLYETRHHRHRFGNANLAPPILFSSDPGELRSLCFLASFYVLCQLGVSLSQNSLLIK
ncbi:unnamed protein product [Acanthoscelides obtectus]|uniref:Peptidase metallopeptidase domain-containing protein n=1 Tax=Acanthoscelides obtectus TaxID=200917 RepID=A0A9P0PFS1_ACAOB|nr:unnamed protein product [Acanthoscelides obtectus]CAK1634402.1 Putative metalloproteinase 165R [Acanthoscelides obtectus]